jgi:hypothetical protein
MPKISILLLLLIMAFYGCKKSDKHRVLSNAADSVNALFTTGKGIWKIDSYDYTYYDSHNNILRMDDSTYKGWYYIFYKQNVALLTFTTDHPGFYSLQNSYMINTSNGHQYLDLADSHHSSYQILSAEPSSLTLQLTDTTSVIFPYNGVLDTANHFTIVIKMHEYTGN